MIVPASSQTSSSSHRRGGSKSSRYSHSSTTTYSRSQKSYYDAYAKSIDVVNDHDRGVDVPRSGRTKFPRKLVNREAVEELGYPYTIEDNGAVTVLRALGQPEIETLVDLTEEIRRRSNPRKAVSFYEKTLVHEVPPSAPSPPPSEIIERPGTPLTADNIEHHNNQAPKPSVILVNGSAPPSSSQSTATTYVPPPPKFEPLSPPGPSTPKPTQKKIEFEIATPAITIPGGKTTPEEKILKAEEKAIKAEKIATKKEHRAFVTGRATDEHEAWKARNKAEELKIKVLEKERKERLRYEKREIKRTVEQEQRVRVGRNRRGDVILIKG